VTILALDRDTHARGPLERCVGDPHAFLRDAWGHRPAIHAGVGDHFDDLLTLDDVDRFLTTTALRTPYFRLVKAGDQIPEASYTRSGRTGSRDVDGIVDPARVAALFHDGATIVLQGVHRWSEPVTHFTRDLELELSHPCQVNAYITPPGAQGLDLHEDAHDVFVVQAFGSKRWQVHAAPGEETREPFEAEINAGDTMYMPAGTPHAAAAQHVVSGHLTVGVHVTPWREVLQGIVSKLMGSVDGSIPAAWTRDPDGFSRELRERLRVLAEEIDHIDANEQTRVQVERWLSTRAQLARGSIAVRSAPLLIVDATVLRRRGGAICEVRGHGDLVFVMLGDRRLEMPRWLEPAMRRIAAADVFTVEELASIVPDPESRAVLARRLILEGLLTASDRGE
jgi:mannose-6-phosphate isomerase-like protein (cupin superfamily)